MYVNATNRTHSDRKLRDIKLLNELKSATPQPTEAKRNMAVKMEVKLRCVRNVFFKRISVLNIQLSEFST